MSSEDVNQLKGQYDDCISKVNSLSNLIRQLSNENELQNLEEVVVPEEFLNLLANSLYAVNSLTYAYCSLKSVDFPPEFAKVKQYYNKAKNPLTAQPSASSAPVVNKQAVKRVIQRSIK